MRYFTPNRCLKECMNRDIACDDCLRFSNWVLPEECSLGSVEHWVQLQGDPMMIGRMAYIVGKYGRYKKVNRNEIMEVLREDEQDRDMEPKVARQKGADSKIQGKQRERSGVHKRDTKGKKLSGKRKRHSEAPAGNKR